MPRTERAHTIDLLKLNVTLDEDEVNVTWHGSGDLVAPTQDLRPWLDALVAEVGGRTLMFDFSALAYMNSRTIAPLLQVLKSADEAGVFTTLLFDTAQPWQRLVYHNLQGLSAVLTRLDVLSRAELEAESSFDEVKARIENELDALEGPKGDGAMAFVLNDDEGWFEVDGVRTDIKRRRTLRRVLVALARATEGGRSIDVEDLLVAGWPEITKPNVSMYPRVYVAICTLRRLGLDGLVVKGRDGYRFAPHVEVRRSP